MQTHVGYRKLSRAIELVSFFQISAHVGYGDKIRIPDRQ